jgi:hypothetical protein
MKKDLFIFIFFSLFILVSCTTPYSAETGAYQSLYDSLTAPEHLLPDISSKCSVNGILPENILIKTLSQTFCKGYQFCLFEGKIMVKRGKAKNWKLFIRTGLPFSDKQRKDSSWFASPSSIREIAADDDTLLAFDDQGRMYECPLQGCLLSRQYEWSNGFGWPQKDILMQNKLVEGKRGWAAGIRRASIEWYTDRFGNEHHWGTMGLATVYFLTTQGQEIRFTDSGLPADFSRTIMGPERGRFIAENISASGSTLFLIDKGGAMYTRLIDFDTMGCDPMFFKYTYIPKKQTYKGSDYRSNFTKWGLPNEDWARQSDIPLKGRARLTKYISIFQNGKGNNARVLRVAGISSDGRTGYYEKSLTNQTWAFIESPLVLPEDSFLPLADSGTKAPRGPAAEYSYKGIVLKDGQILKNITCTINDMTLTSEGSCHLNISNGVHTQTFYLYLVEMWTYMKRYNPVFDNMPKSFFVTPEFNEEQLTSSDKSFSMLLTALFGNRNLELFSFTATASGKYLSFTLDGKDTIYTLFLSSVADKKKEETEQNAADYEKTLLIFNPTKGLPNEKELMIDTKKMYIKADIPELNKTAYANSQYISIIRGEMETYKQNAVATDISRWGYNAADFLAAITLLNQIDIPKIKTITSFGDRLMNMNAENYQLMAAYTTFTYPHAVKFAQNRMDKCNKLIEDISRYGAATVPATFRNDVYGYYNLIGIQQQTEGKGTFENKKYKAELKRIDDAREQPVLLLLIYTKSYIQTAVVEFNDLPAATEQLNIHPDFSASVTIRMMPDNRIFMNKQTIINSFDSIEGEFKKNKSGISLFTKQGTKSKLIFRQDYTNSNQENSNE